ncbi:hypothetical protein QJQ45_020341 [Haematococcus lacustris]|nr:hypothetical protein QJQ45_020341 [Haematococcus lacustris]
MAAALLEAGIQELLGWTGETSSGSGFMVVQGSNLAPMQFCFLAFCGAGAPQISAQPPHVRQSEQQLLHQLYSCTPEHSAGGKAERRRRPQATTLRMWGQSTASHCSNDNKLERLQRAKSEARPGASAPMLINLLEEDQELAPADATATATSAGLQAAPPQPAAPLEMRHSKPHPQHPQPSLPLPLPQPQHPPLPHPKIAASATAARPAAQSLAAEVTVGSVVHCLLDDDETLAWQTQAIPMTPSPPGSPPGSPGIAGDLRNYEETLMADAGPQAANQLLALTGGPAQPWLPGPAATHLLQCQARVHGLREELAATERQAASLRQMLREAEEALRQCKEATAEAGAAAGTWRGQ